MTTLGYIILANLVSTLLSIGLAALLSFRYLSQVIDRLVPVSAGLLLATAVTHLLPEAIHSGADPARARLGAARRASSASSCSRSWR